VHAHFFLSRTFTHNMQVSVTSVQEAHAQQARRRAQQREQESVAQTFHAHGLHSVACFLDLDDRLRMHVVCAHWHHALLAPDAPSIGRIMTDPHTLAFASLSPLRRHVTHLRMVDMCSMAELALLHTFPRLTSLSTEVACKGLLRAGPLLRAMPGFLPASVREVSLFVHATVDDALDDASMHELQSLVALLPGSRTHTLTLSVSRLVPPNTYDCAELARLTELTTLTLCDVAVSDGLVRTLSQMHALTHLHGTFAGLTADMVRTLANGTARLQTLHLGHITPECVTALAALPSLTALQATFTQAAMQCLHGTRITHLHVLMATREEFKPCLMRPCVTLRHVSLGRVELSDASVRAIAQWAPHMTHLHLRSCHSSFAPALEALQHAHNLTTLHICCIEWDTARLLNLASARQLRELTVQVLPAQRAAADLVLRSAAFAHLSSARVI
jgi:hypothetical protein